MTDLLTNAAIIALLILALLVLAGWLLTAAQLARQAANALSAPAQRQAQQEYDDTMALLQECEALRLQVQKEQQQRRQRLPLP